MTILTDPLVSFGRETCGDLEAARRREWLVANGLGGYASGTLAGIATRRYHGLLVAALTPPVGRTVLVAALDEWATSAGRRFPLSTHEFGDGTLAPHGIAHLQSFALEGTLPVWVFALGDALLERRLAMPSGQNTTCVVYRLPRGAEPITLDITPLVTYRDFHTLRAGQGWQPRCEPRATGVVLHAGEGTVPFRALAERGVFTPGGTWWWNFLHREETARGLDDRSDLYAPGTFSVTLAPGATWTLTLSAEEAPVTDGERVLAVERARQAGLLRRAAAEGADPVIQHLVLAADQCIVESHAARPEQPPAHTHAGLGRTVIAGYHWFNDWGRDTMIALPGLALATGRADDAARILRTFARFIDAGLLPNNFPDRSGAPPGYNTADATLWYVLALRAYALATGDHALVDELLPALREIIAWHVRGTRYGIGVDPVDGLLRAGAPGVPVTWMDARVGEWVVTPRIGKVVEINALWYNALRTLADFLAARGDTAACHY
nr:glycogen debranching enzyme N-terminal domain-containing protein [Ktedonobacterales bacterium]